MKKVILGIDKLNYLFGYVAACLCFLMVFLITYEVVVRYFFNAPTLWSFEINQYLFCAVTMFGGGYCLLNDGHVRVDLFYPKFSLRNQSIIEICTFPLAILFFGILFWLGSSGFWMALVEDRISETVMAFPLWPLKLTAPLGALLVLMQIVSRYMKNIRNIIGEG